ncbi:TPA: hypothetical protein JBC15_15510 [Legionella pneumophila subsp. pneumophila]|uniref:hypothetical protein n=1 Tax=Legionella pneumophila TaxID=446 RepID=UPI0007708B92|nr:hypothetical protein [Legionella pneumophila]HAT9216349.1 hypothetical protein [Legionella pneumophila subsp. pneumophila]CZI17263.1 Uncharacterised protein [Legionella pneumophila]HAT9262454.1 hypothetical protein [Legionella pneumophila subsp. pneumophila]HAT9283870.1 hypothetical protein [Legionella pneumophila subsp. pneumophila]HAT9289928.1 hypothetical protein [Legionella pneumophila subsp. pneumophila]
MRKNGAVNYKKCRISWMAYGENNRYSAEAWVTVHAEDTIDQQITDGHIEHQTINEAKEHIIQKAKGWLDSQIASGHLKPIK